MKKAGARSIRGIILFLATRFCLHAEPAPPFPASARARELIQAYHLDYLPGESGYYGNLQVSSLEVEAAGRRLKAHSSIYYLLTREAPLNYLHRLDSDDVHILLEGGPVEYLIFHPDGKVERRVLGRNAAAGESLMVSVPGGCWKALRLLPSAPYALMANILTPQWTPGGVKIGAGPAFLRRYVQRASWASPDFLRALIGPNWQPER